MQPGIENQSSSSGLYLYSFAPSSGVGFYLTNEGVFRFDLVTKEQSQLEGAALVAERAEFDQVKAEAYFTNYEDLLKFTSREYLRDKKNTLYGLLFSQRSNPEFEIKTLRLLNQPEFADIEFSERALPVFKDIAKRDLLSSVVDRAYQMELDNVQNCLVNELQEITFDTILHQIDSAPREYPSALERTLGLVAKYVSLARRIPEFAQYSIMRICDYGESNLSSLSNTGIGALAHLLTRFDRPSPDVDYALALRSQEPALIQKAFVTALLYSKGQVLTELSSRIGEFDAVRDERVASVGQKFLDSDATWELGYLWRHQPLPQIRLFAVRPEREFLTASVREIMATYAKQTPIICTNENLRFSVEFVRSPELIQEPWESFNDYLEASSFWLAVYADPRRASRRLFGFRGPSFWYPDDLFHYDPRGLHTPSKSFAELFRRYNYVNVISLALMDSSERNELVGYFISMLTTHIKEAEESDELAKSGLPHPEHVLLSNFLAWAMQTKQTELANRLVSLIREYQDERFNPFSLSPFIRFII